MAFLFEFLPLFAFYLAFRFWDIYVATGVLIAAVLLQLGTRLVLRQPITLVQKASAVIMLALGGLTLALHDDRFILWKPTIFYWAMAGAIGVGQLLMGKPVLELLMGAEFKISEERWRRLTWLWIGMLALLGVLNLYIAFNFSREIWVYAKIGLPVLFTLFIFAQGVWIVVRWNGLPDAEGTADAGNSAASKDAT